MRLLFLFLCVVAFEYCGATVLFSTGAPLTGFQALGGSGTSGAICAGEVFTVPASTTWNVTSFTLPMECSDISADPCVESVSAEIYSATSNGTNYNGAVLGSSGCLVTQALSLPNNAQLNVTFTLSGCVIATGTYFLGMSGPNGAYPNSEGIYIFVGASQGAANDVIVQRQARGSLCGATPAVATIPGCGSCSTSQLVVNGVVVTPSPTLSPTVAPTAFPTVSPTVAPTNFPTEAPLAGTAAPTATLAPTVAPTVAPTPFPTRSPTVAPTPFPTVAPTSPTEEPTTSPPTEEPTPATIVPPAITAETIGLLASFGPLAGAFIGLVVILFLIFSAYRYSSKKTRSTRPV